MTLEFVVFDEEVLPNCFICVLDNKTTKEVTTFEISERRNDYRAMIEYFKLPDKIFVGYNCSHYDTPIMNMLIMKYGELSRTSNHLNITKEAYELSNTIINGDQLAWTKYKHAALFKQIDLMTMMASKALRVGLKSLQVTMCYKNVKEMGVKWSADINIDDIDGLIFYCKNDVDSTGMLLSLLKDDLSLRQSIKREFKIECLSKDGVGIGVDIFTKFVCAQLGIRPNDLMNYVTVPEQIVVKDLVQPCIKFKTKQFQDLLDWFNGLVINVDDIEEELEEKVLPKTWEEFLDFSEQSKSKKYKKTVVFNKLAHSFALGGVHSINTPCVYEADDDYYLWDEDVESYYPSLALGYRFGPDGFKDVFLKVMQFMKDERVVAKKIAKDKTQSAAVRAKANLKNEAYKLALNSILGNLKNKYSPYYAPHANVGICVNGQLMLAMLIEECELAGIPCISSNTDGATFRIKKTDKELFEGICANWKITTKMNLETTLYEKMVIYAVNDYIAFKIGYSEKKDRIKFLSPYDCVHDSKNEGLKLNQDYVKEKGMFITSPRLGKGLDCLIIAKAIQNYYGKGIPIEETIKGGTNIWDFLRFEKVGRQFEVKWNSESQQHINRYYISKKGAYLYKEKFVDKVNKKTGRSERVLSKSNMLKGFGVNIFNEYIDMNMAKYDINYTYYIHQANKIIHQLQPIQQSLF